MVNPTTAHTYVRFNTTIYVGDAKDNWRQLHNFHSVRRARRWQRDQDKKRPGSVQEGPVPQKLFRQTLEQAKMREQARLSEIRKLVREQARDQGLLPKSRPDSGLSGKTARLAQAYVAPDRDESSSSRKRLKKRAPSQNGKGTRANSGVL